MDIPSRGRSRKKQSVKQRQCKSKTALVSLFLTSDTMALERSGDVSFALRVFLAATNDVLIRDDGCQNRFPRPGNPVNGDGKQGFGALTQQTILITGCSSGIGYDAAVTMRSRGWRVFATCRKEVDCIRLRQEGFECFHLDYEDVHSIEKAVGDVLKQTGGTLDALFNNGAYAIPAALEDVPTDALRAIFEANLFGWHDLTCRVIPVMRAQGHGRIVQCSSVLGFIPMPWRGAYVATKYALEGLSDCLRLELNGTNIRVILIEPGPIRTRFRHNAGLQFRKWIDWEKSALSDRYREKLIPRLDAAGSKKDRFELPPSAVSGKLVHALESPRPAARYFVTTPTYVANFLSRLLPTRVSDMILGRG